MESSQTKKRNMFFSEMSKFPTELFKYLSLRMRQVWIWSFLLVEFCFIIASNIKKEVVKRMFWGRNSFYRQLFHVSIIVITFLTFFNGIAGRMAGLGSNQNQGLNIAEGQIGYNDMILQYANAKTFTIKEAGELPFDVIEHEVQEGESLETIAKKYSINDVSSIQWANDLDPYSTNLKIGQVLKIPPMVGVLKEAKEGDTPESIIKNIENAYLYDVLELNDLQEGEVIAEGRSIFVPNGDIPLPPPKVAKASSGGSGTYIDIADSGINIPAGTFVNPLGGCSGYSYSRGYSTYHTGVDLAKRGGCWIQSIGPGVVQKAQWCPGGLGFCVVIKHPNGVSSLYAHGDGTFAVKAGETVSAGQKILYMGNTGNSYGTHLHFSMAVSDQDVINCYRCRKNPKGIVPY